MPGEEKQKSPLDQMIYANGRDNWAPEKYERFGLYVFLYNYVRANLDDFSPQPGGHPSKYKDASGNYIDFKLTRNSLSTQINDAIYHHYDWFVEHLHLDEPISILGEGRDLGVDKNTFLSEFYDHAHQSAQIMQMNSELNGPLKGSSTDKSNMSTEDLLLILRHKEDNVRRYFDNVRNSVEGKPRDLDKEGKPIGGYLTVDMTKALQEKEEKIHQILENTGSTVFYGVLSAGGIGTTVVSAMGILAHGELAVSSLFGAAFMANPVAATVLSAVGLVVGVKISKESVKKFITKIGTEVGKIKDYFHFMVGMGDYATKNGIPKGFNPRKERYETALELKAMMTKFKIPAEASKFDEAFEAFWQEQLENSRYIKHFSEKELKELHKNARYTYQVTNGLSSKNGASLFGRLRGLVSAQYPTERVDYKFENVDECTRHFKARLREHGTGKPNLGEIKKDLEWLDANSNFFTNAKREDILKQLMSEYKTIILSAVDKVAFDEPIQSHTIGHLNSVLENSTLGDRIKSGINGEEKKLKGVISFLSKEKNLEHIRDGELFRESVTAQLDFKAATMVDACTGDGFGPERVTGTMVDDVKIVAEFIERHTLEDEKLTISGTAYTVADIRSIIETRIKPNTYAYNYLKFMLEKKTDAATLDRQGVLKYANIASTKLNPASDAEVLSILGSSTPPTHAVVNKILGAATMDEASINALVNEIETTLNFGPDDRRNKNYLLALLARVVGQVKDDSVLEDIVTDIANLSTDNYDAGEATEIREKIRSSNLPPIVCIGLSDWALSKQTQRLDSKKTNDITARTLDAVRAGGCLNFEQIMSEIEALEYEKINDPATQKLYENTILRELSYPFKEYFEMVLRKKVQELIERKLRNEETLLRGETGLDKNAEYLQFVSTNKFLTDVQKEQIYTQIASYIESAASASVERLQRDVLFNKKENKEVSGNISTYLTTGYANKGLKEFFATSTEQSQRVYGKLSTFKEISNAFTQAVTTMSQYNGRNPYVVDPSSEDAKFIVSAFFLNPDLERQEGDKLLVKLQDIHSVYTSEISSLQGTGLTAGGGGAIIPYSDAEISGDISNIKFLSDMNGIINNVATDLTSKIDQLAALRSLKRHALEAFKFQLVQAIGQDNLTTEDQVRNAINSNRTRFDNIIKVWKKLMHDLDAKCKALAADPEIRNAKYLEGKSYVDAEQTIDFFNSAKNIFDRLRSNDTVQPSM